MSTTLLENSAGTVWFESNDAYGFEAADSANTIIVEGDLRFPENHNGKAVIMSHGSGGVGELHRAWRALLMDRGFAVFVLDHFTPRNTLNVLHSQVRVTEQQMAMDILNAFALLRTHPKIDSGSIFHMGWSKGATAGLVASLTKVRNRILPQDVSDDIAGIIAFYPWCGFRAILASSSPILILHGQDDDYTPIDFCRDLSKDMVSAGARITIEDFDGAVHGFDNWHRGVAQSSFLTVRRASEDCTLQVDPDTLAIHSLNGKYNVDSYDSRKSYLTECAERGVMLGGSPQHRERTIRLVTEFITK